MLIDFRTLFPKYKINPTGVLHIGGNVGEEFPVYMELGIHKQIWIEPNPEIFEKLVENISTNSQAVALNWCAGDENKSIILHESNNAGQSSSILELGTHKQAHPEVHYIKDIQSTMFRVDDLLADKLQGIDFLNIDVQGAELLVLKGIGEMLNQFKWIYLEVNKAPLYVGCALIEEIDDYLEKYNFIRIETKWAGNTNWGDALYVRVPLTSEDLDML
jgi:FkbM family methyltransferase